MLKILMIIGMLLVAGCQRKVDAQAPTENVGPGVVVELGLPEGVTVFKDQNTGCDYYTMSGRDITPRYGPDGRLSGCGQF